MTEGKRDPLLADGQNYAAVDLEAWERLQVGMTQLTQASVDDPTFIMQDTVGGDKYLVEIKDSVGQGSDNLPKAYVVIRRYNDDGSII